MKILKKLAISSVLIAFSIPLAKAQNAEEIYQKFSKIEAFAEGDCLYASNKNVDSFTWEKTYGFNYGIKYHFFVKNNFDISVGISNLQWESTEKTRVVLPDNTVFGFTERAGVNDLYKLPIEARYIMKVGKTYGYFLSGVEITYNNDIGSSRLTVGYPDSYIFTSDVDETSKKVMLGLKLGAGVKIPIKYVLLDFGIKYHYSINPVYEGHEVSQYYNETPKISQHSYNGNYLGISLGFSLKKKYFQKVEKRKYIYLPCL